MKKFRIGALLLAMIVLTGCIPNKPADTDHQTNFEALWKIIDEKYCFHDLKGVDWDEVHVRYSKLLKEKKYSHVEFFYLMNAMLNELKDGHVNLYSEFDVGYAVINLDVTKGLNVYARSVTIAKTKGSRLMRSGGMNYGIFMPNDSETKFGYIGYGSFSSPLGNMPVIFSIMKDTDGIILDLRGNGGGSVDNSNRLISYFLKEKTLVGYSSHKTGPGRFDFSKPKPLYIEPNSKVTYTEKPVIILQDRSSYSATNEFLYKVALAKNVYRIGQKSGGGSGMPASSELPNGWKVRYSAVKNYDHEMKQQESGVEPNLFVENVSYLENPGAEDLILLEAMKYLVSVTGK